MVEDCHSRRRFATVAAVVTMGQTGDRNLVALAGVEPMARGYPLSQSATVPAGALEQADDNSSAILAGVLVADMLVAVVALADLAGEMGSWMPPLRYRAGRPRHSVPGRQWAHRGQVCDTARPLFGLLLRENQVPVPLATGVAMCPGAAARSFARRRDARNAQVFRRQVALLQHMLQHKASRYLNSVYSGSTRTNQPPTGGIVPVERLVCVVYRVCAEGSG